MAMMDRYNIVIQWSDEDQLFLVHLPDFPGQRYRAHGVTRSEALQKGQEVLAELIEVFKAEGWELPEPKTAEVAHVAMVESAKIAA